MKFSGRWCVCLVHLSASTTAVFCLVAERPKVEVDYIGRIASDALGKFKTMREAIFHRVFLNVSVRSFS